MIVFNSNDKNNEVSVYCMLVIKYIIYLYRFMNGFRYREVM